MDLMRQADIFVPSQNTKITIIGAGGIGSWVALGLSKTGFKQIEVWDGDIIEEHNLPNQVFNSSGNSKCITLQDTIPNIQAIHKFWNGETIITDILVLAVDSMETRKKLVESQRANLIIDGRIGGENIRVLSISPIDYYSREYYLKTWYPDGDAERLPCTARAIADVGFFVGGIICNLIRRYLKDKKITREVLFDASTLDILKIEKE